MTDSSWSTIDQLLDRTCAQIEQENVLFNNRDLDVFLRKWKKAGTFPIDNESPIQEMIPPIRTVIKPMIRVSIRDNLMFESPRTMEQRDG
ncbi:hypothetical protein B9Z55_027309 [Caenorhabditis nigoni]|uniref:F-box associated domain-containing protein n=1 Tax=Caenorhabditis nigoni TaxID=1611254 RepID=A0A2G5SFY7_9PELO|nr:hypothetical protein B9Z55_027309 [Caenorhabditis nigoni]